MHRGKLYVGLALGVALAGFVALTAPVMAGGKGDKPAKAAKGSRPVSEAHLKKITAALPEKAQATPAKPRKVLIFTLAKGFVHSSIPVGAKAIQMMGEKTGAYESVISNDRAMFEPDKLKEFDAIVLVSTTGAIFGNPKAKKGGNLEDQAQDERLRLSLLEFIAKGKGIVGIHAASDANYQWPAYGELIGGYFNGHPWGKITMKLDDPSNPINACFHGKEYTIQDEIYTFRTPYSRDKLRVLTSIDIEKSGLKKGFNRQDNDYAVSWIHNYGRGRVFYCSLGHREETFFNPVIMQHYLAGIQFALGDLQVNATPSSKASQGGGTK